MEPNRAIQQSAKSHEESDTNLSSDGYSRTSAKASSTVSHNRQGPSTDSSVLNPNGAMMNQQDTTLDKRVATLELHGPALTSEVSVLNMKDPSSQQQNRLEGRENVRPSDVNVGSISKLTKFCSNYGMYFSLIYLNVYHMLKY